MSLLEKAKQTRQTRSGKKEYSPDEIELAVALQRGEITWTQASSTLGTTSGSLQNFAFGAIKQGITKGIVSLSFKK